MERSKNERIVFSTDLFIIIIIAHFTTMVMVANHWNYVKSAFLFTWPPALLLPLPLPLPLLVCLCVCCMHIHLLYLFYLCKQVMRCTHKYTSTLYMRNTDMILNQITLFFPQFVRVYLLEQTNTINEYKRKQIELIFRQYELRIWITCASNYILHYITGTACTHTHTRSHTSRRENSHILIEIKERAKWSEYKHKVCLKYDVYVLWNAKDHSEFIQCSEMQSSIKAFTRKCGQSTIKKHKNHTNQPTNHRFYGSSTAARYFINWRC